MRFVDEIKLNIKAGDGGDGVVRWRREKFIPRGGPAGGDGGKGGDVFIVGVRNPFLLSKYKEEDEYKAGNGDSGKERKKHGKDGKDLILEVPVGSVVTNTDMDLSWSVEEEGQKILILHGGQGGLGNDHFKSGANTTPRESTPGKKGEHGNFHVEVTLLADVGLIGYPNAGKSSLLNALTNSRAKTAEYAFTTLEPNLADFYGFIIADIPGLIEGASEGKGLGSKFLRHIKRTKLLIHLVSCENDIKINKAYEEIRKELESFGHGLSDKEEIILLTKTDVLPDKKILEKLEKSISKYKKPVYSISLFDDKSVKDFMDILAKKLKESI